MSEGTKIGEYKDNQEFNAVVQTETTESETSKATKLGGKTEFERSLEAEISAPVRSEFNDDSDTSSMENLFQEQLDAPIADYNEGDIVRGVVRAIEKSGVLIDISYKSDGFIFNNELSEDEDLVEGQDILVFIDSLESKEGYTILSRKKALVEEVWNGIMDLVKSKEAVKVKGVSQVQGGVVVSYKGVRGFVPASQIVKEKEEDFSRFLGIAFDAVVLQADRRRKKVIFSHKQATNKIQKNQSSKVLESLEVGQTKEGKVTSIKDFGVFVDLDGVEGLVHISELSWSRVNHPSDLVSVGDTVNVFVLGVDKDNQRISLGMKQLETDPWVEVSNRYTVGQVVTGKISRVAPFGAFIKIQNNLEGLIHISELSFEHVKQVEDVVKVGDEVEAKIIKLVPEEQKIGLSLKGVHDTDESTDETVSDTQEAAVIQSEEVNA